MCIWGPERLLSTICSPHLTNSYDFKISGSLLQHHHMQLGSSYAPRRPWPCLYHRVECVIFWDFILLSFSLLLLLFLHLPFLPAHRLSSVLSSPLSFLSSPLSLHFMVKFKDTFFFTRLHSLIPLETHYQAHNANFQHKVRNGHLLFLMVTVSPHEEFIFIY